MHQAVQQPSIQRSWWSRLFAHPEPLVERRWVSFPDLVRVHLERTRVLDSTADMGERRAADAAYDEARRDFERAEGQIVATARQFSGLSAAIVIYRSTCIQFNTRSWTI